VLPGVNFSDGTWREGVNRQAVKLQGWIFFFVFLGYGWVDFDSIVLPPTFHSCTHTFSGFSTSNQAFTLKQNI